MSRTIICRGGLIGIYSSDDVHCKQCGSADKYITQPKKLTAGNNRSTVMEFDLRGGGEDGEYSDVSFVKISAVFVTKDAILLWNGAI